LLDEGGGQIGGQIGGCPTTMGEGDEGENVKGKRGELPKEHIIFAISEILIQRNKC
jgi:hypothetical protein